jgi:predicted nucleotidyltransferase
MLDELRHVLADEPDIAYAVVFGSNARRAARPESDVDIAIELRPTASRDVHALGSLAARLESAAGRRVDLVLLDEAPASLAYRIFRDGRVLVEHDHRVMVARKARAMLAYLDWKPVEERCAEGILRVAAARGR